MVAAMVDSEDAQSAALASFVRQTGLTRALQSHDWVAFARGYNGPNFAVNQYDVKLAKRYQQFAAGPLPDLEIRTAQLYLTFAGYAPGPVDGTIGPRTRAALIRFQTCEGLPMTGSVDCAVLERLEQVALI